MRPALRDCAAATIVRPFFLASLTRPSAPDFAWSLRAISSLQARIIPDRREMRPFMSASFFFRSSM